MEHLKKCLSADPTDRWAILNYMQYKHAPETEKLARLTGEYTLLSPLCPNPDRFKPVQDGNVAARSPHVSFQEYKKLTGYDDGYHWDSKQLSAAKYCYSLYPTLGMLQEAEYVVTIPRNYVRFVSRRIQQKYLVEELFDWKNR